MPFTLWSRDLLIGETDFELGDRGGTRHIGVFRPAPSGMMLLPSITAMAPALFEFGLAAKRAGFSAEPEGDEADACLELLEQCGPGQRMLASAKRIAELELRDPDGRQIHFESILVSDLEELRSLELGDDDELGDPVDLADLELFAPLDDVPCPLPSSPSLTDPGSSPETAQPNGMVNDPVRYLISATFSRSDEWRRRQQ